MTVGRVVAGIGLLVVGCLAAERVDEQVKRIGRGVNIIGYDPIWEDFAKGRFKERHFKVVREGGFRTVRINLHALSRMDGANRLSEGWLGTLDWAVKNALANELAVILDLHNFTDVAENPAAFRPKIMAFWKEVAARYKDAPPSVIFEILNEPNGKLTPALWNEYWKEALGIIRESNPTRTVIVGPPFWNGIGHLRELELPAEDRNLIVTVHYYEPMRFTHQGAPWTQMKQLSGIPWGSEVEKRKVEQDFAGVAEWAKAQNRPILLGEFGAYDKADMESRARYTAHVARTAEALGWAWTYWQFDSDFVVYDIDKDAWVKPIWKALAP
jgi:endoglucanase